jgi:hypothetical protein
MAWSYPAVKSRFREILVQHGQDIYLRRRCTSCTQTGPYAKYDDNCVVCAGTGYEQTLERYTMRRMVIGNQYSYAKSMGKFPQGIIVDEGDYFFCEESVQPKHGDIIYDFDYALNRWIPFEINKVLPRRWDNRIVFYNCAVSIREGSDT